MADARIPCRSPSIHHAKRALRYDGVACSIDGRQWVNANGISLNECRCVATIYRHLGIDATRVQIMNFSGRPVPILQDGTPIPELAGRA